MRGEPSYSNGIVAFIQTFLKLHLNGKTSEATEVQKKFLFSRNQVIFNVNRFT